MGGTNWEKRLMLKRALLAGAALTALVMPNLAAAESLQEALAAAYSSNPDLLAQRAAQRAVDENLARANANLRPTIQGQGNIARTNRKSAQGQLTNTTNSTDRFYQGQVVQPLFRGLRTWYERKEAKAEIMAGRADLLNTEQQVLLDAVTAYMNVIRDQAVRELNEGNVQVLERQLEATRDRFRVGEVTRTDVAQSEAALAGAQAQLIQAEADLESSRATYRRVIGRYPGTLEPAPELPNLPGNEDEALTIALDGNPIVLAAEFTEEAAEKAITVAKGQMLPTLEAQAGISRSVGTFGPFTQETTTKSVGAQFRWPLYQGGAVQSDVRRAKQVQSQRRMEIFAAERQVMESVRTAWEQYRAAQSSIESTESQVRANEIALDGVRQEALVGSRTVLDVLDAEQALLNSRVDLVTAQRNEYVAAFQLLSSIGRLNAVALDLPVEVYDPTTYYDKVSGKFIGWDTDAVEYEPVVDSEGE